jgi:hypothetical protein
MFHAIRTRINATTVLAGLALVFAMTGGAYAAKKYLITSTKQISPSVLKTLQGKAGAAGAQGPAGPAGPQGAAGAAGAKGDSGSAGGEGQAGKEGKAGKDGATGATGAKGPAGPTGPAGVTGSPWLAGGTLPSGKTESGSWMLPVGEEGNTVISFPIPLPAEIEESHVVPVAKGESGPSGKCTGGTAKEPKADKGFLCIYVATGAVEENEITAYKTGTDANASAEALGVSIAGARLFAFEITGSELASGKHTSFAAGTWAVTAP